MKIILSPAKKMNEEPEEIKRFHRLNYVFREELFSDREYIFIRE